MESEWIVDSFTIALDALTEKDDDGKKEEESRGDDK